MGRNPFESHVQAARACLRDSFVAGEGGSQPAAVPAGGARQLRLGRRAKCRSRARLERREGPRDPQCGGADGQPTRRAAESQTHQPHAAEKCADAGDRTIGAFVAGNRTSIEFVLKVRVKRRWRVVQAIIHSFVTDLN